MNYQNIASQVVKLVGGKDNINSVMNCATRLRFQLKDTALIKKEKIEEVEGVKGVFEVSGQLQIIFGSGIVNNVCASTKEILGIQEAVQQGKETGNLLQRIVKTLSDIFVPIIPAIVAGGLLMGINNVLTASGLFHESMSFIEMYPQCEDIAGIINLFANAPFVYLPVLLGFSATKKFGGNPYLGAAIGMIMVHPDLLNAYSYPTATEIPTWNLLGLSVEAVAYQGTVLPVLGVSWILATIEKKLHKVTPAWLDNLTTPMLSIVVTGFITFILVGPILREAGVYMANGITWIYDSLGFVGAGIFGFLYAPIVITGLHHSFSAVETALLATTGETFIFTVASMSNVAQGAAVLAVLFVTKDTKIKSICSASGVSALLGITEPAMFGVNLRLKYPFVGAICGSALGCAYLAITNVKATALGAAGLPGFLSVEPSNYMNFAIGILIAVISAFIITIALGKRKEIVAATQLLAPMNGEYKDISESGDEVFSNKTLGDGMVILPSDGNVYAPCDGEIVMLFDTLHAIGLKGKNDLEVLIHCGINTVTLEGKPFKSYVSVGQQVKQGDLLLTMDIGYVEAHQCLKETLFIISSNHKIKEKIVGNQKVGKGVMSLD